MPVGPALGADILNYVLRGQAVSAPTTLYASLGTFASGVATEIGGSRVPIRLNKGVFRGSTPTDPNLYMLSGEEYMIPANPPSEVANPRLFFYKASTGGDPYFIGPQSTGYPYANIGDMWSIAGGITSTYSYTTGIADATPSLAYQVSTVATSAYYWTMLRRHFWMGEDAIGTDFPVGTYPDVYFSINNGAHDNATVWVPRFAVPRATGSWSVPAMDSSGRIYVTNAIALNCTFTVSMSGTYAMGLQIAMFSARPGYDDRIATTGAAYSYNQPGNVPVFNLVGDTVIFPVGSIKVVV